MLRSLLAILLVAAAAGTVTAGEPAKLKILTLKMKVDGEASGLLVRYEALRETCNLQFQSVKVGSFDPSSVGNIVQTAKDLSGDYLSQKLTRRERPDYLGYYSDLMIHLEAALKKRPQHEKELPAVMLARIDAEIQHLKAKIGNK